jgi:4-hydroxybenzoate polyprenyltransferase
VSQPPFVIDLDGTLLKSDLLVESGLAFARDKPSYFFMPIRWLLSGKAYLKEKLAQATDLDVTILPYNDQVIALIKEQRALGRTIILATASHKIYADKIAEHLQLFDRVLATEHKTNLSAHQKRDLLVAEYGLGGFDYVGNSQADIPIWQSARKAYVVEPEYGVVAKAIAGGNVEQVIKSPQSSFKLWIKALRVHQWAKNLLIFVPLLASHQLNHLDLFFNSMLGFIFFCLCASSVYLLNDLLDLADDRQHITKRYRPFAAGSLPIKQGLLVCPLLLLLAFAGSLWLLPFLFTATLAVYYVLTLVYSMVFKRRMVIDVITLAALYTLRIIAGAFVILVWPTFWMLAFSMFIFLSLALVKRYAELHDAKKEGKTEKTPGRGYFPSDLEMLSSLGAASGYLSVLVLALYIQDQTTIAMYQYPQLIWLACPLLLFWVSRIWLLTHRGVMHEDPVVFAFKDKISLIIAGLFGAIFWLAQ